MWGWACLDGFGGRNAQPEEADRGTTLGNVTEGDAVDVILARFG